MNDIDQRPDPSRLLAAAEREGQAAARGKLKIFFGYAAGVGKTYAMLQAAHRERAEGIDVVVGYVEPHGRAETEALLVGLETLPTLSIPYRDMMLREFDLDAALKRRPNLILVDELAHTNAEGLRHAKRWQDVAELLDAGINVYTTLNVQHIESLNDVIAQITGVVVRETLPDSVLERADDIELIDLTPEELIERLKEGKVYVSQQAERALQHFFQKANLTALREISLRQVAQRLSKDVEAARQQKAPHVPWATQERLLVCVSPSPTSARLIRTSKRMATAFGAEWMAVAVEPSRLSAAPSSDRQRVTHHLQLAERLGAETHALVGDDIAQTLLEFAIDRNVTKIVIGKSRLPRWRRLLFGTVVDAVVDRSGDIDVYIVRGEAEPTPRTHATQPQAAINWSNYWKAGCVVGISGLAAWLSHAGQLTEANIVMVFLLGVTVVASLYGRGPAIATAIANVIVFDVFFVPPILRLTVSDAQYLLTFAVMLIIGLLVSALTARTKEQLAASRQLQRRTDALYRLTKQLTEVAGPEFLIRTAGQQLQALFDGEVIIYLRSESSQLQLRYGENTSIARNDVNVAVANWVADHDQIAGLGTDTLPNATALFVPLLGSRGTLGAVGIRPRDENRFSDPEQSRLLETCASLIALSLERDQSVIEASEATVRIQAEEMRSSLLSSVSHDLRTPLSVIAAACSNLLESPGPELGPSHRQMVQSIADETRHLSRLVENLLDMTRLEAGAVAPKRQWQVLEEIVGSALARTRRELGQHHVKTELPNGMPLVYLDDVLMEQVFVNLLENAARYTPPGSTISISAAMHGRDLRISVADNGPGLIPGTETRIFEKFFRAAPQSAANRRGVGLGLAISRAIVQAHGGTLMARNRPNGGAEFIMTLPIEQPPPQIPLDESLPPEN
jgi:two-component system sensor histidine kinase KdpD